MGLKKHNLIFFKKINIQQLNKDGIELINTCDLAEYRQSSEK